MSENKKNGPVTSRTDSSLNTSPDHAQGAPRNSIRIQQTNSSGGKDSVKKSAKKSPGPEKFVTNQKTIGVRSPTKGQNISQGKKFLRGTEENFSIRQKVTENDHYLTFSLESTTGNFTDIFRKKLYRQKMIAKRLKKLRIAAQREEVAITRANSLQREKEEKEKVKDSKNLKKSVTMNQRKIDGSPVRGISTRKAIIGNQVQSTGKKFLHRKSQKQPEKKMPELTEPKKGRSSIMDERTSTVSPLAMSSGKDQQILENKKLQVKQLRQEHSLSRMSRDYSIDSIESIDDNMHKARTKQIEDEKQSRGPVESRSSINIHDSPVRLKVARKDSHTKPDCSPHFNRKQYRRQNTNAPESSDPPMLLNVSYEPKVKMSSSRGRCANTRNNSRGGEQHEQTRSKKALPPGTEVKHQGRDDSLSNGPSDLNKKLKMLSNKQRGSTDLHSQSVISKKEMVKLQREQRIYDLYMKAPYKLMDKKQGERQQRKLDIDEFMNGQNLGEGSKESRTGSSYFQQKRATMNSYMSQDKDKANDSTRQQQMSPDREAQKRGATNQNLNYLQQVFEKRQQEQDFSRDRNSKNSKLSMNDRSRQSHSPGAALMSCKMPKNMLRGSRRDQSPIHQGGMALINTEPIHETTEELAYAHQLKLPVDKRRAERKNTWGSSKDHNTNARQYVAQPQTQRHQGSLRPHLGNKYESEKKVQSKLNGTQLSAVKSMEGGKDELYSENQSFQLAHPAVNIGETEHYRRRNYPHHKLSALGTADDGQDSAIKERQVKCRSPGHLQLDITDAPPYSRNPMDVNYHLTQVYGSGNLTAIANMNTALRAKQLQKMSVDKSQTRKYVNTRIYDNVTLRPPPLPQTTALPSSEMPILKEADIMRPKFLGGQYTNKIHKDTNSAVKEFLAGQQRSPDQDHMDMVEQYYKNKLRLRNNLENIYKSKGRQSPNRRRRDELNCVLPEIEPINASAKKIAAAQEFSDTPSKNYTGHVSIKKQLEPTASVV